MPNGARATLRQRAARLTQADLSAIAEALAESVPAPSSPAASRSHRGPGGREGWRRTHGGVTPVELEGLAFERRPLALAPLAVVPARRGAGIGSALVRAGLEACRAAQAPFAVVLGDPRYYVRFGFVAAARFGLRYPGAVRADAFQALELEPGALARAAHGHVVRFAPPFEELVGS